MLITTCTHCLARFRVTPQQLNAKQGQVRCGRCKQVFSGFEALERFPDDDTGARLLAAREAAERGASSEGAGPSPESLPEVQPVDGPVSAPAASTPETDRASVAYVEPPAPTPSAPHRAPSTRTPPRPRIEYEETDPVVSRPSRAWGFGVFLLLLVLAAEGTYAFRTQLAERFPQARPWLVRACAPLRCAVGWRHEEEQLRTEESDLYEVPGTPGEFLLTARVRNLAPVPQAYPYLDLTLTDRTGQAAAKRVLKPVDYLGRAPGPDEALAPGADLAIQLRLATPRLRPTGYHVEFFYSPALRPPA